MKMRWLILFLVFGFLSCSEGMMSGKQKRFENKSYVHLFYSTEKDCEESQPPDFFINCHQQLDLYPNSEAEIMLTDIIWRGTWELRAKEIIVYVPNSYEIPSGSLTFKVINTRLLKLISNNTEWKLLSGNSIWN